MKTVIRVTQQDIINGTRKCDVSCPIALAVNREITQHASVFDNKLIIHRNLDEYWDNDVEPIDTIPLDEVTRDWLDGYDQGFRVEPLEITIHFKAVP